MIEQHKNIILVNLLSFLIWLLPLELLGIQLPVIVMIILIFWFAQGLAQLVRVFPELNQPIAWAKRWRLALYLPIWPVLIYLSHQEN